MNSSDNANQTVDVQLPLWKVDHLPVLEPCQHTLNILLSYLQPMPRGLYMHESREESKLWLHQLRHFQLGFPGLISPYDSGFLGKLVSVSKYYSHILYLPVMILFCTISRAPWWREEYETVLTICLRRNIEMSCSTRKVSNKRADVVQCS